jgi:sulfoxide reductase heme-binding subunit YedZ
MTTWIILRAAGIGAYVMLFLTVAFGLIATSTPFGKRFAKASSTSVHQFMSTVGLLLLGVHIGGLLLDQYVPFGPTEILVPGASTYRPIPVALGVLAMYAMVLVLASSWVRRSYSPKIWRAIHVLSIPAFVLSFLHGVFAGADAARPWMLLTYVLTGVIVVFLLVLRGFVAGMRPARRTQSSPRSVPPPPSSSEGLGDKGAAVADPSSPPAVGERVAVEERLVEAVASSEGRAS